MRYFIITLLLLFVSGCTYGLGEGVLKIKGNIVDTNEKNINQCFIELHSVKSGVILYNRKIDSSFEVSFVIAPSERDYFIVFRCPEIAKSYKSNIYKISGASYYDKPLNLGKIVPDRGQGNP